MINTIARVILLMLGIEIGAAMAAGGSDVKIIANAGMALPQLSSEDLARIFLITKTSLGDGCVVEPVLQKGGRAYALFLKKFIGKTDQGLTAYYKSLVFTGKASFPKILHSDEEVVAYVSRTKGAIGYVSADAKTTGVKIVAVK